MNSNLPAVITAAASAQGLALTDVSLIMPTETFGAVLGEFDKVTIETVSIAAGDPRETYEPNGEGKGFALSKVPLQKIATALSIQWHPQYTGIVESTATRSRAKAVGVMRKANGETIVQTEEKTIDLDVERENERAKAEKNSLGGRVVRWENRRPIKEPWKSEDERLRWIELEIENSIKQKKRFKDELAMTGAKDRVIRAFLALKSTYTAEELSKPLAFPRVTTDTGKLLADPRTRAAAIGMIGKATSDLFGAKHEDLIEAQAPEETTPAAAREPDPAESARSVGRGTGEAASEEPDSWDDDPPAGATAAAGSGPKIDPKVAEMQKALYDYIASGSLSTKAVAEIQTALDRGETDPIILADLVQRAKAFYEKVQARARERA
jgi:hypothetical protein